MSENKEVPNGTYKLSSIEANTVSECIGNTIRVSLDNGREFFGTLEKYDDHWLHLKTIDA
jgi:small nuclear ribonucleoprotein (snRNP)-like protein